MTDHYEVEAVVGRGAMGVVYRARHLRTGRQVAYKRVPAADAELVARLRREAEALARLDHPHIVDILDVVEDADGVAIVMPYAGGGNLAEVISRRGGLPAGPAGRLLAAIADALASAHRSGILHRDVKPANILFTTEGHPLLSDFGVARIADGAPLTAAGAIGPATGEYLDPAVAEGAAFDERSDCYALGVVGYELLTGRRPFAGETPLAVLRAADAGHCEPLAALAQDAPPALVRTLQSAMARDPLQRPAGAAELAAELRAAVGAPQPARLEPVPAAPTAAAPASGVQDPPTRRFGPRPPAPAVAPVAPAVPRWGVAAAALLALLLPLGAVAGVQRVRSAPHPAPAAHALAPPSADLPDLPALPVSAPLCDDVNVPAERHGAAVLTGDLEGRGCRSWVRYEQTLLRAALRDGVVRVHLGRHGDVLLLGDWDCDGSETPALYRPATGEVFSFNTWAGDQPVESEPARRTGVIRGEAAVEVDAGCAEVVVRPGDAAGV